MTGYLSGVVAFALKVSIASNRLGGGSMTTLNRTYVISITQMTTSVRNIS
jgi:hypothetical protein